MQVKCANCGLIHDLDLEWQDVGSDERQMGPEIFHSFSDTIHCDCGNTIDVILEASEYPQGDGIRIYNTDIKNGKIV